MDLTLGERHRALRADVTAFIEKHGAGAPKATAGNDHNRPCQRMIDWQELLIEHGYAARTVPHEYGGYGAAPDVLDSAIIAEAFSHAGISPGLNNQGIRMVVPTLLEVGSEEQRRAYIPDTIRGRIFWCQGYSEPSAGSDLASLRTCATVEDGQFVINGQKIWTSFAHYADMMYLLCRTEPDKPRHGGLSYLLLSMRTPGIEVRPLPNMTERHEFNEVFFTDVRVPLDQMVMGRGDGWRVAMVNLKHERGKLGDPNKLTQRLHRLVRLLEESRCDGRPLIELPSYRDRLLDIQGQVLAWKAHSLRLLTDQARDQDPGVGAMIVKYGGTSLLWRMSALAVDALGAAGLSYELHEDETEDDPATTWNADYMYDIAMLIGGGTSNIQKNIIGERGLGLPAGPKGDASRSAAGAG